MTTQVYLYYTSFKKWVTYSVGPRPCIILNGLLQGQDVDKNLRQSRLLYYRMVLRFSC